MARERKSMSMDNSVAVNIRLFCASIGGLILMVISLAIPISMIVMGSIHLNNCPADRYIPIYLIVFGVFTVFVAILRMITDCCTAKDTKASVGLIVIYVITLITGPFVFAWFIAGNVWIYRLRNNYAKDPADPNYCDNTFYLYAFWITTSMYIMSGVVLVLLCMCGMVALFRKLAN